MRLSAIAGVAVTAAALTGAVALANPASAAALPCGTGANGSSANGTCWSTPSFTWKLVVDCKGGSIKWPVTVTTVSSAPIRGAGSTSVSCPAGLKADPRIAIV
jgi:hypothetical protein